MSFEELYQLHSKLVYNLALQYTQNIEDAQEITQDVFLIVHEKLGSFQEKSNLKTWIYRITINKSLDFIKSKNRQKRWTIFRTESIEDSNINHSINFNHPGVELEQKEATNAIFKCINQLPTSQKSVIILLKIECLPQAEVAEILNTSTKAVESLFQRAKKNLKKLLEQNEGN